MNIRSLVGSVTVLLAAAAAHAVPVEFSWTQSDASTGFGMISGTIDASSLGGPAALTVTGAPPLPTVHQKDSTSVALPPGIVGFMTQADLSNPGVGNGVHLGWSGHVTLTGGGFEIDVPLIIPAGSSFSYEFGVFDDNGVGNDAANGDTTFAAWIGDDGGGHRHSDGNYVWVAGPDGFTASSSGLVGVNSNGDALGITLSVRDGSLFTSTGATIFVDELRWSVTLDADPQTLRSTAAVAEPATALLGLVGAAGLMVFSRSRASRCRRRAPADTSRAVLASRRATSRSDWRRRL